MAISFPIGSPVGRDVYSASTTEMDPGRNIVQFGTFMFDGDTRQLLKGGKEIHLSPKAFELLEILLSARPKALSKAELQNRLWPDSFVTEANLPGLVKEIRQALGDDPRSPRFIRTLHGFGYAFRTDATGADRHHPFDPRIQATCWIVAESQIRLAEGPNILGRDPDVTVWFDRPGVSRRHARIVVSGDEATIEDLGSTNGTWLCGNRVLVPAPLHDGDEIRLGPVAVTFRIRRGAASTVAYQDR